MAEARPNTFLSQHKRTLAILLFLGIWIVLPFYSLVSLRKVNIQDDIFASDLIHNSFPCRVTAGEKIRQGEYPSWTSGIYTGFPLLAQPETGALYPTNVLFFTLLPPYLAIMLAQILALLIAGGSLYLLARQYGLPVGASLLGAGAFCLSGFFVSHLRHPSMIDAACWIPLQLLLVERIIKHRSAASVFSLALVWAAQLLAGHPQISYYSGLVMAAVLVLRWRREDRRGPPAQPHWPLRLVRDRIIYRTIVALALGTAIAGAQLLPATELALLGDRGGGLTYEDAAIYPAAPRNILTLLAPGINGDPAAGTYTLSAAFWEEYAYLGLLPLLLALIGTGLCFRKRPIVRLFAGLTILAYLLALGKNTPLFKVAYWVVPGMSYFRFPTRFLVFVELALAILAAFGLAELLTRVKKRPLRQVLLAAVFCLTAADLWFHQPRQVLLADKERWTGPIITEQFLAEHRDPAHPWRYYSLEAMRVHAMTYQTNRGWAKSVQPYIQLREILQPSFNLLFQQEAVDGYINMVPGHLAAVWGSAMSPGWVHPPGRTDRGTLRLRRELVNGWRAFNVKYVVSPYRLQDPYLTEVFTNKAGVAIYQVRDVLPRAFVVGDTRAVSSADEAERIFAAFDFDPATTAVVHEPVQLPPRAASSQKAHYERLDDKRVSIHVQLPRPGLLVLSESYYPGWQAALDGKQVPVIRANVMMKAVVVPAGKHEVVFSYESLSTRWGVVLTFLGLIALLVLGFFWRKGPSAEQKQPAGMCKEKRG